LKLRISDAQSIVVIPANDFATHLTPNFKNRVNMKKLLWSVLLATAGNFAYGNGYQVMLQSNRVTAMGNTGTGIVAGSASIFFNPGALGFVNKTEAMVGVSLVNGRTNYVAPNSFEQYEARPQTPSPHLFFVWADSTSKFRAGLGVFAPYGSTVEWEEGWSGRYNLTSLSLRAIYIQPTVAYKVTDWLSVGAGLDIVAGSVNLQRSLPTSDTNGEPGHMTLDGKTKTAFGYNLGVYLQPSEKFSLGLNYRSAVDATVEDGDATFEVPAAVSASFPSTTFGATLPLPSVFSIGVGYKPSSKFTLAADVNFVGWSAYEALTINFGAPIPSPNGPTVTRSARNYENSRIYHIGAELSVIKNLDLRFGAYYDESPVPNGYMTPETPDADAVGLTAGFGFKASDKITIDGSFLYLNKEQRENVAAPDSNGISGTYKASALIPGLGVSIKF
jgi:long-chain fatty acid transport protein